MSNAERPIVAKFGGSSMADAEKISGVADIITSDPNRRIIVVSAPGVNASYRRKVTDLLATASAEQYDEEEGERALDEFSERFSLLGRQLGCSQADEWIQRVREGIFSGNTQWAMSRGEWLTARMFAHYLDAKFIDAEEIIQLHGGQVKVSSFELVRTRLQEESGICVIPGFYGIDGERVRIFPRGGSDITGAIIARGVNARVYENWTDVDGVLAANPKVVHNPKTIEQLTYEEMRELGIRGATVLQRNTILPLVDAGIPINVRNTFNPVHSGTMIMTKRPQVAGEHVIGIAGEAGFVSVNIQKYGMNEEEDIGRRILQQFSLAGRPYEHSPSGRDYMSVLVSQDHPVELDYLLYDGLNRNIQPDRIWIQRDLGLISVVGQGISDHVAKVSRMLFSELEEASIPVRAFNYGTSGISMVVAVENDRLNEAIYKLHNAFIKNS